jgi:hypothetical protein
VSITPVFVTEPPDAAVALDNGVGGAERTARP